MNAKRPTARHIIIKIPKVKDKERILKSARDKQLVTYRKFKINFVGWNGLARNIQSHEKQGPIVRIALPTKISFRIEGQIKSFPDKKKLKEFIITKPLFYEML